MDWTRVEHDPSGNSYVLMSEAIMRIEQAHASEWNWWSLWWIPALAILLIWLIVLLKKTFFTVQQQTPEIIERFGRYHRIVNPGLRMKIPFVDYRAKRINVRVHQLPLKIDTKTLDNVFVELSVAIQYAVLPDKIWESAYKLNDVTAQISAYVFDIVRGKVPKMNLDSVFDEKDSISNEIKLELNEKMAEYGYTIFHAPVTDVTPDERVRDAMNQINTNKRLREAATEKGEAEKVIVVKQAEAKKQSDILKGEGIAGQRKAIVEGLKAAVEDFAGSTGVEKKQVLQTVLMTQYFDMLRDLPKEGNTRVLLLPHSPNAVNEIGKQVQQALLVTE